MSRIPDYPTSRRPRDLFLGATAELVTIAAALLMVGAAISAYAAGHRDSARIAALATLIAAGAFAAGGLIGFLFAIPRSLSVSGKADENGGQGLDEARAVTVRPNTNLEDVSDWLTKIIVGVTLTQLGNVPAAAARLFDTLGGALGGTPQDTTFAGAMTIFCAAFGFLVGWLTTRVYISRWMAAADLPLEQRIAEAIRRRPGP